MTAILTAVFMLSMAMLLMRAFTEQRPGLLPGVLLAGSIGLFTLMQPDFLIDVFNALVGDPGLAPAPDPSAPALDVPWAEIGTYAAILGGGAAAAGVLGAAGVAGWRALHRHRAHTHQHEISDAALRRRWEQAIERYNSVREAYAAYATDALAILDHPQLNDVTDPATQRFLDALADADYTHREQYPAEPGVVEDFDTATRELERTWRAALQNARTAGTTGLSSQDSERIATARRLLHRATHPETPVAERQNSYRRARAKLRGVLTLPAEAIAALEARNQFALPPGESA